MPTSKTVLSDYAKLSITEQNEVKEAIVSIVHKSAKMSEFAESERFKNGRRCVFCGSEKITRNGKHNNKQRFICNDCRKSFYSTSNSITSGTRNSLSTWIKYIDCMMTGFSLRRAADICSIHYNTAFAWRHKILDALRQMEDETKLSGIVEADETFFDISYKGNHKKSSFIMPRKPHERGGETHKRGISNEKVCVACAVNRNGLSIAKTSNVGRLSIKDLHKIFDGRIEKDSLFISDKHNAYARFSKAAGLKLIQLKSGREKRGIYNIQHINNYHSRLKRFILSFSGVSTKYMDNYLVWNNFVNYSKEELFEKKNILLRLVLSTDLKERAVDLSSRPAVPV